MGFYEGVPFIEESSNVLICKVIYRKEISPEGFVDQAFEDAFYKDGTKHIIYVGELVKVLIR